MRIKKIGTLVAAGAMALSLMGACSGQGSQDSTSNAESALSGQLTAAGATALQPLVKSASEQFMAQHPDLVITVNGGGSGEGLKQVSAGSVNIGNSDVFAEEKLDGDAASELVDHKVALVAMAPVVNVNLGVDNLTKQQLIDIFTGKTTNWKDVGGPDEKILLVTRPSSSGTRATFQKWALDGAEEASNAALETDDSGTLVTTISQNEGAIGYVALSYLANNDDVVSVKIDGVEPTMENVYNGSYHVWSYEHMYTKGDPDANAKAFLEFIMGEEFAPTVEEMGYGVVSQLSDEAAKAHE